MKESIHGSQEGEQRWEELRERLSPQESILFNEVYFSSNYPLSTVWSHLRRESQWKYAQIRLASGVLS